MRFKDKHFYSYISTISDGNIALHIEIPGQNALFNREKIANKNGFSLLNLVGMKQTHSNHVKIVTSLDCGSGAKDFVSAIEDTDAMVTDEKNVVLSAQSADCALILFIDPIRAVIAVAHAGWRGVVNEVIINTLKVMQDKFGSELGNIEIQVAPNAMSCCYEVQKDVVEIFLQNFSTKTIVHCQDKYYLDLNQAIFEQLINNRVNEAKITFSKVCTICNSNYYSFRRQKDLAGRIGAFIWMS